jgi:predicted RNase H-like HicB family nuclease
MSSSSKKSSKISARANPRTGFDEKLLAKAREIVLGYSLIIERMSPGSFVGRSIELPGTIGHGSTYQECAESTLRTQSFEVCTLLERGEPLPEPASSRRRTVQLNLRISPNEKQEMEQAALARGFRSISDFVREAALAASAAAPSRTPARRRSA